MMSDVSFTKNYPPSEMTKRKRNQILNLGSYASLRKRKIKKTCTDSGEKENVCGKTSLNFFSFLYNLKMNDIGSSIDISYMDS